MLGPTDPRDEKLARTLIRYSTRTRPGDLVFIECRGLDTLRLGAACAREAVRAGAAPYVQVTDYEILRAFLNEADEEVIKRSARFEMKQMKDTTVYIAIRGLDNSFELSDVPRKQLDLYNKHIVGPVHLKQRVKHTRWCVLRYPNSSMAQMAQTSTSAFGDFYYKTCLVDYARMAKAAKPLKELMDRTDAVHIKGPGTDLEFSIKGIPAIPCCGNMNIPDGECFTAPVRTSVSGVVRFNTPTLWEGSPYENVCLRFKDGKVIEATAVNPAQTKKLNQVLDSDRGARFVGEFALGFHPHILQPMRDTLFDEKIAGSFHMAMGDSYDEAPNGNKSAVHWDMVCIQRPDFGGGEIHFDGKLIRRNGEFVTRELRGLNRANYAGAGRRK
jgi:aminopeptidase